MRIPRPLGPILEAERGDHPVVRDQRPDWPKQRVGGKTFLRPGAHKYDWVQVLDPDNQYEYDNNLVGLSGVAISPEVSEADNPFLHPLGNDFEFYLAPDPYYTYIAAPQMLDEDYRNATTRARTHFGVSVQGVVGVEWDGKMVPAAFRAMEGDRVALWGRWIVDSGHDDFHTEIHPPLLMATARRAYSRQQEQWNSASARQDATVVSVITRPYLVSQEFYTGGLLGGHHGLFDHLLIEVNKILPPPTSLQVEAHPILLPLPFRGRKTMTFTVRPSAHRMDPQDVLVVEYSFTRRGGVSVGVSPGRDRASLDVTIVLDEAGYTPPPMPQRREYTLTPSEIEAMEPDAGDVYTGVIFAAALVDPEAAIALNRGIKTSKYAGPHDPVLGPAHRVSLAALRQGPLEHAQVDDRQPFPLFGTIRLEWKRANMQDDRRQSHPNL